MLVEAIAKGSFAPGKILAGSKSDPTIIEGSTDYITGVEKLRRFPVGLIEMTSADITRSHGLRRAHVLFVNGSIDPACADRLGVADVVAQDADFRRVTHIRAWEPQDV